MNINKKILLICSNKLLVDIVVKYFRERYHILLAEDELESMKLVKLYSDTIELMIADVDMLWINFTALITSLKELKREKQPSVIAVCNCNSQRKGVEAAEMGVAGVIVVPCEPEIIEKAISNVITIIDLKQQVLKDSLTKLYNRAAFEEITQSFLKQKVNDAALIMIDMDNFKNLNDTLGHDCGDMALVEIASRLKEVFKDTVVIGRLGGDEFAVFIPNIPSRQHVLDQGDRICEALDMEFTKEEKHAAISSSLGIAFAPEHGIVFEDLYCNADRAQYESKKSGKNRITVCADLHIAET